MIRLIILTLCILSSVGCVSSINQDIRNNLYLSDLTGIRWGILVTDSDGEILVSERPDDRFSPASNTKIVTTIAAYEYMDALQCKIDDPATYVSLEFSEKSEFPDVVIVGKGDLFLRDSQDCEVNCLADLADQIAMSGVTRINNIVGDDSWFPDERWSDGWSWEDLQFGYGTAISSLIVNDNVLTLDIGPGQKVGDKVEAKWVSGDAYYTLSIDAMTVATEIDHAGLHIERIPGSKTVSISGEIPIDATPAQLKMGVDDPAHYMAWRLKKRLEDRSVQMFGQVRARHRDRLLNNDLGIDQLSNGPDCDNNQLASHVSDAIEVINKESQNLYAETLLRQLAHISGTGSVNDGLLLVDSFLKKLDVDENGYDLFDGSGMSVYNRITPRTLVTLLNYAALQDWGAEWKASLPIGGVDGGLKKRFLGTILEGNIVAKTGTLKGVNALSGYMVAASGKTLTFSIIANDRPLKGKSVISIMDKALVKVAMEF